MGHIERLSAIMANPEFKKLGGPEARALIVLLSHCVSSEDGVSWPSVERLASLTHMARRETQRALARLEDKGFIVREPSLGRRSRRYQIPVGAGHTPTGETPTPEPVGAGVSSRRGGCLAPVGAGHRPALTHEPLRTHGDAPPKLVSQAVAGGGDPNSTPLRSALAEFSQAGGIANDLYWILPVARRESKSGDPTGLLITWLRGTPYDWISVRDDAIREARPARPQKDSEPERIQAPSEHTTGGREQTSPPASIRASAT